MPQLLQQSVKHPQIDLAEAAYITWRKSRETADSTWPEEGTLA